MKKSLVALAVLASVAGFAQAQSAVTVYGVADLAVTKVTGKAARLDSSGSYNQSGSRIGFRGTEDLGGGLKASFALESGIRMDTGNFAQGGSSTAANGGIAFGRQAWAALEGSFGGIKLGRQNSTHYKALLAIDPFEDGFAGAITNSISSDVRLDNTASYSTPGFNGFNAEVQYTFGETTTDGTDLTKGATDSEFNRNIGLGISYANGPATARFAYQEKNNTDATTTEERTAIGGTWDFGAAKAHLGYNTQNVKTNSSGAKTTDKNSWLVGVSAPVGPGKLLASYVKTDDKTSSNTDRNTWAVGYNYGLSKRTSLYTSYASYKDRGASRNSIANVGVRHAF